MTEYDAKVRAGAEFLDANVHAPVNWRSRINLGTLDLTRGTTCVLGQVFGSYYDSLEKFQMSESQADLYGFTIYPVPLGEAPWNKLNAAWIKYLRDDEPEPVYPTYEAVPKSFNDGVDFYRNALDNVMEASLKSEVVLPMTQVMALTDALISLGANFKES